MVSYGLKHQKMCLSHPEWFVYHQPKVETVIPTGIETGVDLQLHETLRKTSIGKAEENQNLQLIS